MAGHVDIEELVHLEQTFFDAGYEDGFAHGRIHGLIEGRALGGEKGFEIWEEIGFYQGFASTWQAVCAQRASPGRQDQDQRALHHIKHVLDLIHQFPTVNPSPSSSSTATTSTAAVKSPSDESIDSDLDISKLQCQIRSRYKALCASLGVRPTLRAGPAHAPRPGSSGNEEYTNTNPNTGVWTIERGDSDGEARQTTAQGLSF